MKQCQLCNIGLKYVDYKNIDLLKDYTNQHARIIAKRHTGNCARCQRDVANAIKRARFLALMPYISN